MPKRIKAKGNEIGRRSGASPNAQPRMAPVQGINPSGYGRAPLAPLPEAYGPPREDFGPNAPPPSSAIAQSATAAISLAPRPVVDKFPIVVGPGLSFAYLSACQRTALTGYRMQYVDLLREILERDPHLYAVVWKTILGVANGRLEITPAELPEDHPDTERAKEIALDIERKVRRISGLRQSIATLGWGAYYGVSAAENHYDHEDDGSWYITSLGFIHSRRLSYPDMGSWDLYIWDQGQVLSAQPYGSSPTNSNMFGLRVADYPHKFIVFAPQMSGDYPTREGFGRLVAEWALSKRLSARNALQYLERFIKPWPMASFNTGDPESEHPHPRVASDDDIASAEMALGALGTGGLSSWTHPDSVTVTMETPDKGKAKLTFKEYNDMCNEELSKGVVGSTLTTNVGSHGGNRALGSVHKAEEQNVVSFFADTMSETLKEQLVTPLVLLNYVGAEHLVPQLKIHVEDEDPKEKLALAKDAAASNIPVDADEIGNELGLPLVQKPAGVPSRRMMPLDVTAPTDLEPELAPVPGEGTAGGEKLKNERTKAAQPHVMPGATATTTKPTKEAKP